jgi:hypothetical protein
MLIVATALTAALTSNASALVGGIGDQNASTFSDANFKKLKVKRTRYIVAWDAIIHDPARVDQWVSAARAAKLKPVIAFNPTGGSRCPSSPCVIPSAAAYKSAFKAWRKKYPWIKEYNFWNETNSPTQPTGPSKTSVLKKTGKLYKTARSVCKGSCVVTGPDILDLAFDRSSGQKRFKKWLAMFYRYGGRPKIWGFHNYGDTNYRKSTGTKFFLRTVRGRVWVTETGGVVQFKTSTGKKTPLSKYDEKRAARGVKYAYTLARKYRSRIQRLYYYQWRKNNSGDFFDAGIVNFDGSLRPSYAVLRKLPKSFWR